MYRKLILLLLCIGIVLAAPQKDSKITYVKRQVNQTELQPNDEDAIEARIEKLPPTVPSTLKPKKTETDEPKETTKIPMYNYSDRIYSIKHKKKNETRNRLAPEPINSNITADILPLESIQTDTVITTNKYETDVTGTDVTATEKYEDTTITVVEETTKATTAKPLPKLSHYGKSSSSSFSHNLIGTTYKRRFRSRCRCEKIWNCTKLQITVPRCPEEYFLCCS